MSQTKFQTVPGQQGVTYGRIEYAHPFHGFAAERNIRNFGGSYGVWGSNAGTVIVISSKTQDELHEAAKSINLVKNDLIPGTLPGTGDLWTRYQANIKTTPIYNVVKTLSPLGIFHLEPAMVNTGSTSWPNSITCAPPTGNTPYITNPSSGYSNTTQTNLSNNASPMTFTSNTRIPFVGCASGMALSFVALCWRRWTTASWAGNTPPQNESSFSFAYDGYYTGTVTSLSGNGDMRLETTSFGDGWNYDISKISISDSILLEGQ